MSGLLALPPIAGVDVVGVVLFVGGFDLCIGVSETCFNHWTELCHVPLGAKVGLGPMETMSVMSQSKRRAGNVRCGVDHKALGSAS